MSIWFKRELFSKERLLKNRISPRAGKLIPLRRHKQFQARTILAKMITDCLKLGATEVFIGSIDRCSFEFVAQGQTYSGTLPLEAVEGIKELTSSKSPISLDWDDIEVEELKLGISKGGATPVYCFSWRSKSEAVVTPAAVVSESLEEPSIGGALILVVDDDLRFCQILSRILEEQGFQTLIALNGKEALVTLESFNPALIITDVHMPHLSGPEFLLESRKRGYQAPYLVLTNDEDALTEAELVLLGASAFIKKSEDPRVLLAWCRRLTSLRRVA